MAETFIAIAAASSAAAASAGAAISSIFAGGAAAGGAAAAGGITAGGLSTALSIGSAFMSIGQGIAQSKATKQEAAMMETQAQQTAVKGAQERESLSKEYAALIADQQAVQIANGLNPGVGTAQSVRAATTKQSDRNLSISRENTAGAVKVKRMQSRALMKEAKSQLIGGFLQAGMTGLDAFKAVG